MTRNTTAQDIKRANKIAKSSALYVDDCDDDAAQKIAASVTGAAKTANHPLKEQASSLASTVGQIAGDVKDKAVGAAETAGGLARDIAGQKATEAKDTLADEGYRLAQTMRTAAADRGQTLQAKVLEVAAGGVDSIADSLSGRSIRDLFADVQAFAGRNPGVFVAGAAVAGFAVARFVRSGGGHELAYQARQT
jgi:hypothetical protein